MTIVPNRKIDKGRNHHHEDVKSEEDFSFSATRGTTLFLLLVVNLVAAAVVTGTVGFASSFVEERIVVSFPAPSVVAAAVAVASITTSTDSVVEVIDAT